MSKRIIQKEHELPADVAAYMKQFPANVQDMLMAVRATIRNEANDATECMRYGIPTFQLNGNLVHYAAFTKHIGFYPGAAGIAAFKTEIDAYKNAKGSVQFPFDKKIPFALIAKITKFRVKQNLSKPLKKPAKK